MSKSSRPEPARYQDHQAFWDGTDAGQLLVQRCAECGTARWPPRILCGSCLSRESAWVPAPTTGALFSWTVVHHTTLPGFRDETPYAVGLVELVSEEGTLRMLGGIRGCPPEELFVGQAVRALFDKGVEATLVNWEVFDPGSEGRPAAGGELS
jgi:uncharacterized protein